MSEANGSQKQKTESGSQLRQKLEETLAENRELKEVRKRMAFTQAGIRTETGLGKLLFEQYEGQPDRDSLARYVRNEYGPDLWQSLTGQAS